MRVAQFIAEIQDFEAGGSCAVTLITLNDGRVLGINDESIVLYPSMEAFNNAEPADTQVFDISLTP